jgi:predicted lipase
MPPGHSLGGALAVLAAYDIRAAAHALGIDLRVTCYTFGQPRVGNHAFAKDFSEVGIPPVHLQRLFC